jgi:hypothetical protein
MSYEEREKLHDLMEQSAKLIIEKFPKDADGLGTQFPDLGYEVIIRQHGSNTIHFTTNTAFLLNMWFPKDSCLWKNVAEWVKQQHEREWTDLKSKFIKVTFEIVDVRHAPREKK